MFNWDNLKTKLFSETSSIFPPFSKVATSKTQSFCETSSNFELDNVKNERILQDFLNVPSWRHQKRSNSARLPALWFLPPTWLKYWACHEKWCQVIQSAAPVSQNHLCKPDDLMLQNQPLSGNQRPDLLTSLMNMSLVPCLPGWIHLCRSSSNVPRLNRVCKCYPTITFCSLLGGCRIPCACHKKDASTSKSGANFETCFAPQRRTLVHFLNISTSQSALNVVCFVHFDFEICFAPQRIQRRALFNISISKSVPNLSGFNTFDFWLRNDNGVHFFDISSSKSGPNMRCFVHFDLEMCFGHIGVHFFDISTSKPGPTLVCFVHFDC